MTSPDESRERETLLNELRGHDTVDAVTLERVLGRVLATVTSAHLATLGQTATTPPHAALPARIWRTARGSVASSLLVGVALGAGGHALVRGLVTPASLASEPAPSATGEVRPRPPSLARATTAAPVPVAASEAPSPPTPAAARSDATEANARSAPSSSGGLSAELDAIEAARQALTAGTPSRALKQLTLHEQRYPRSMVAQERDALVIKALVAMGHHTEARAAGARFLLRYPNGLLRPAVEASLATIP